MGPPRRVTEPHSDPESTAAAADTPAPEARVGRACVPVDDENLKRCGWSERTDKGRRRIVRETLRFAAEIGVQVVIPPAKPPPDLPAGTIVVSPPPPKAFRSNGEWAADLMKRVARHYLIDAEEGSRAVESNLLYGLTRQTSADYEDYLDALTQGLKYLRGRLQAHAAGTQMRQIPAGVTEGGHAELQAALVGHVALAGDMWGLPESPYACARVLTRAHTERVGSALTLDGARSQLRPLPPSPYGDTLGGWFAWHLAETRSQFRQFEPAEFAADCNEWLAARAAEDLLDKADLRDLVDGVAASVSSPPVRDALDALPVPPDDLALYGMLVSDQAAGWNRHPLSGQRPQLDPVDGVEPAAFRELDSRRPADAIVLENRILGLCARSGVAVQLHDADRIRSFHAPAPTPGRLAAHVIHPVPERFGSTEDWGRSLLGAVALAVQTHPQLYDHARLDRLFGKDPAVGARMFDDATRALCDCYGLDRAGVVACGQTFEAKPVADRGAAAALAEIEDLTGAPTATFEVARRAFWTALGDAFEREGVARGWADASIAAADRDHTALEWIRRAAPADVPVAVRGCGRALGLAGARTEGTVGPAGAIERAVADIVADRLLSNFGAAVPTPDLEQGDSWRVRDIIGRLAAAGRPADAVLAEVAPEFAVGGDRDDATVLDIVRERAEAVTELILDPTRTRRSDRMGDVEHSRSASPWRDLGCVRARQAIRAEPEAPGKRGTDHDRAVQPSR